LGGTPADFIAKYGQPNDHSDSSSLHFSRYPGSNVDALIVKFVTVGPGAGHADAVLGQASDQPPDQGWSMATARATCAAYRPPDSKAGKSVHVVDSAGAVVGEDDIYTSATLATQFDASAFTDADSNTVAAGTFDVFYLFKTGSPGDIDSCSLFLGSVQTQP
jgi:hypothetical protein